MPNFSFEKKVSASDKVYILINRYDNKFYSSWNEEQVLLLSFPEQAFRCNY